MLSWLGSIGEAIGLFVQFLTSFITGIINVFVLVAQSITFLGSLVAFFPPVLWVFVTAGISITVLFHLIGR